jgi:6-phosphogluconolactonase
MNDASHEALFFAGTYSDPGPYFEANGSGLYTLRLNLETGVIREIAVCNEVANATYLAKIPNAPRLFIASDLYLSPGEIIGCQLSADSGEIEKKSVQSVHGCATCHISLNSLGTQAYVSSYIDAKVTVHSISGLTISASDSLFQYEGRSSNKERQEAAHAHQAITAPGDRWLYVVDLGSDKVWIHDLSDINLAPEFCSIPAGYGPRHLVCHPSLPLVFLFCELNSMLLTCRRDINTGQLTVLSEIETLPPDFDGVPAGAAIHIHPSLKTLYVSNRNSNSITVFHVGETGLLSWGEHFPSCGKEPRDFTFEPSGRWLVVANQNSNNITTFSIDPQTGFPSTGLPEYDHSCGSPVSLLFY